METTGVQLISVDEHQQQQQEEEDEIIFIPDSSEPTSPRLPKLPRSDLLLEVRREEHIEFAVALFDASMKGDWEAAYDLIERRRELVRWSLTESCETALHVAASAKRTKRMQYFVKNLVNKMEKEDMELQDSRCNTAFCIAAGAGHIELVKIMLKKNHVLRIIPGRQQMMPLYIAALFGDHDTVAYLYSQSHQLRDDGWNNENRGLLLLKCIEADLFDVALRILEDRPELPSNVSVLEALARKPDAMCTTSNIIVRTINSVLAVIGLGRLERDSEALQLLRIIWKNIVKKSKSEIDEILRGPPDQIKKDNRLPYGKEDQSLHILKLISENIVNMPVEIQNIVRGPAATTSSNTNISSLGNEKTTFSSRVLFVAAERGNTKFVVELLRGYPDLIFTVNDNNESIFHTAVKHRHEGIYSLLYEIGSRKDLITPLRDEDDNNMLHLVGKIPKRNRLQDVSGVALQMQRELLWFKEVEAMVPPSYKEERNKDGLTPHELFTEEHKDLAAQGEKWMKDTASQCMVVAALIATVVFAAAFTVPGGYNQTDGIPIFHSKVTFMVFVLADAISLFLSSASIIMFLSILTSRYAERDFLESLPKKLMIGLTTLFLSITTMTIAFTVSFFVLYKDSLIWVPMLISMFAALPVFLFAWLQFPLLADVRRTYSSRHLFRPKKGMLYYEPPSSYQSIMGFISGLTLYFRGYCFRFRSNF